MQSHNAGRLDAGFLGSGLLGAAPPPLPPPSHFHAAPPFVLGNLHAAALLCDSDLRDLHALLAAHIQARRVHQGRLLGVAPPSALAASQLTSGPRHPTAPPPPPPPATAPTHSGVPLSQHGAVDMRRVHASNKPAHAPMIGAPPAPSVAAAPPGACAPRLPRNLSDVGSFSADSIQTRTHHLTPGVLRDAPLPHPQPLLPAMVPAAALMGGSFADLQQLDLPPPAGADDAGCDLDGLDSAFLSSLLDPHPETAAAGAAGALGSRASSPGLEALFHSFAQEEEDDEFCSFGASWAPLVMEPAQGSASLQPLAPAPPPPGLPRMGAGGPAARVLSGVPLAAAGAAPPARQLALAEGLVHAASLPLSLGSTPAQPDTPEQRGTKRPARRAPGAAAKRPARARARAATPPVPRPAPAPEVATFALPPAGGPAGAPPVPTRCALAFSKVLTLSDVTRAGRIILPRAAAERHFPPCLNPKGEPMEFLDTQGRRFSLLFKFWLNGRPAKRMYLLDNCGGVIEALSLRLGMSLDFYTTPDGRHVLGCGDGNAA